MPAWGDRMTEAQILKPSLASSVSGRRPHLKWPYQPKAAEAVRPGCGTSQLQPPPQPQVNHPRRARVRDKAGGQSAATQPAWWQTLDWRFLLLAFGTLSISFTLIFMGMESLRRRPPKG